MKIISYFILGILALWISSNLQAQEYFETAILYSTDNQEEECFGSAVDISGNFAVVGAPYNDEKRGAVFIFERDYSGNWSLVQKIVSSQPKIHGYFGSSVSIDGNYLLVGADFEDLEVVNDNPVSSGAAYIYRRSANGIWEEVQRLVAHDAEEEAVFGYSVSISGTKALVGAKLESKDKNGENSLRAAGAAYCFSADVSGKWNQTQKIVATNRYESSYFGRVALSGNRAVIGAFNFDGGRGAVYFFECGEDGYWEETQEVIQDEEVSKNRFGYAVSISGNYALVGSHGYPETVYFFEMKESGSWHLIQKIKGRYSNIDRIPFGHTVDISDSFAILGLPDDSRDEVGNRVGEQTGSVWIYKIGIHDTLEFVKKVLPSDHQSWDCFGSAVGISNNYVIIGKDLAIHDVGNPPPIGSGSAHIFESCSQNPENNSDNLIENGDFENCILAPWSVYNATWENVNAAAVITDGSCILTPFGISANPFDWHIQLVQDLSSAQLSRLEKGAEYELSFDAFSSDNNSHCHVFFGQSVDPYTPLLSEMISVQKEKKTFRYQFTLSEKFTFTKLCLETGTEMAGFTFDNIKLVKIADPEPGPDHVSIENRGKKEIIIYPNPATDFININAEKGWVITLYNSLGMLVKNEVMIDNQLSIDVSDLPEGIYYIKLNNSKILKLSIQ